MILKIDKSFEKDIDKIKDKTLLYTVADIIEYIEKVENISLIKNLKIESNFKN